MRRLWLSFLAWYASRNYYTQTIFRETHVRKAYEEACKIRLDAMAAIDKIKEEIVADAELFRSPSQARIISLQAARYRLKKSNERAQEAYVALFGKDKA